MSAKPVVLITGASSGIGAAAARLFAQAGYRVALAARRVDRLRALDDDITAQGGEALAVEADVSQLESIEAMVAAVLQAYGRIDVLVNNAGFGRTKWLEELDPVKDIESQVRVNLLGVIHTSRAVLPHMIAQRGGHIINTGSLAGLVATPTYSVYAATKFGVRGFSEALRREVGVFGVRVSVLFPGAVTTEFAGHMQAERKTGMTTPEALQLSSEDVGRAILHLAQGKRSRMIVMPGISWVGVWFNSLLPRLNDWVIERTFTRPERGL